MATSHPRSLEDCCFAGSGRMIHPSPGHGRVPLATGFTHPRHRSGSVTIGGPAPIQDRSTDTHGHAGPHAGSAVLTESRGVQTDGVLEASTGIEPVCTDLQSMFDH